MANKKFSEFTVATDENQVSSLVGYNGSDNVQITPALLLGTLGPFLPLTGGTLTGPLVVDSTATVNDILTAGLGLAVTGGTVGSGKLVLASTNKVHLSGGSAGLILQNSGGTKSLTIDDTLSTFVGLVSGITPVDGANFVTKAYLDGGGGAGNGFLPLAGGTMLGNTIHNDNVKSIYGNPGNDLQIFHDSSNSYIQDAGIGRLILQTNYLEVQNAAGSEAIIEGIEDGAVNLYYNSSKKFETTNTGVTITAEAVVGNGTNGLEFSHSAGNSSGIINTGFSSTAVEIRTGNIERLSINDTTATFAGSVDLTGNSAIFLNNTNNNNPVYIRNAGSNAATLQIGRGNSPGSNVSLVVNNSGFVGIGLADPQFLFQVAGSVALDVMPGNESQGIVRIGRYDANTTRYNDIKSFVSPTASSNYLKFAVHGGVENANVNVMTLLGNGNVGVGAVLPVSKMNIEGTKTAALSTAADFLTLGLTVDDNNAYNTVGLGGGIAFRGKRNIPGVQTIYGAIDVLKESVANDSFTGSMRFYTNQNATGVPLERMRIDSSGNVGIGVNAVDYFANANNLVVGNLGAATGITIVTDGNLAGSLLFADGTSGGDNTRGGLQYNHSNNSMLFRVNNATKMTLDNNGRLQDLTGIFLGSNNNSNFLDDYQEGNWSPTLGGTWTTDPTTITGTYTKIGQLVSITMAWTGGAKQTAISGYFENLPFDVTKNGTGSVSDSGVADRGNCLFANVDRVWLTTTTLGASANYLSGTYHTAD